GATRWQGVRCAEEGCGGTRVQEDGGLSYLPVPAEGDAAGAAIVFANHADQRLYLLEPANPGGEDGAGDPRPLTPEPVGSPEQPSLRYADFTLSPDRAEVWCVQERHYDGKVARAIVAVPLDGSAAESHGAVRELVTGSDFYAFPTPSPDGKRLAWICWNHPRMPWDGTELRVALIEDGVPGQGRLVKGGMQESVLAPLWRDAASLYVVTDWPGWWDIYQVGLVGQPPQALYPADQEVAGPLWQLRGRPYAVLGDGRPPGAPRPWRDAAGPARPGNRRAGRPRHPLSRLRLRPVGGRDVGHRHRGRPGGAAVDRPGGRGCRRGGGALPGGGCRPGRRLPAGAPPGAAGGTVWAHGARRGVPAGPPGRAPARRRAAPVRGLGARRAHLPRNGPARHREGVLHQPGHRHHRRQLRGLDRLRPPLPGAAAPPVGGGRRGGRDPRPADAGRPRAGRRG